MARPSDEVALGLIGKLYDAAQDDRLWPELAQDLAAAFGSVSCTLQMRSNDGGMAMMMAAMPDVSPLLLQEYEQHFAGLDSWVRGAARWDVGTVLLGSDVVPEAEFIRSEFFNDWCRRVGVRHLIGVAIPVGSEATAIVGMHRPADIEDFSQHERDLLGHLKPHFVRALALRRRLTGLTVGQQAAQFGLEQVGSAVLVVDGDGTLLQASPAAEAMLRAGDAVFLRGRQLAARDGAAGRRLAQLIAGTAATAAGHLMAPGGAVRIRRQGRSDLSVMVSPFRPARDGFGVSVPAAILLLRDPERGTPSTALLKDLFGFTTAEAAIAVQVALGRSAEAMAKDGGVSVHTVRSHIRNLMAKTGTRRQGEVAALVLRAAGSNLETLR